MSRPGNAAAPGMDTGGEQTEDLATVTPIIADSDAERAVIGSLIESVYPPAAVLDLLNVDQFIDDGCRFLLPVIASMAAEGVPLDLVTVAGWIESHGILDPGPRRTHLRSWLASIVTAAPVPASLPFYAAIVAEQAARRRIASAAGKLLRLAEGADFADLAGLLRTEMLACLDELDRCGAEVMPV